MKATLGSANSFMYPAFSTSSTDFSLFSVACLFSSEYA